MPPTPWFYPLQLEGKGGWPRREQFPSCSLLPFNQFIRTLWDNSKNLTVYLWHVRGEPGCCPSCSNSEMDWTLTCCRCFTCDYLGHLNITLTEFLYLPCSLSQETSGRHRWALMTFCSHKKLKISSKAHFPVYLIWYGNEITRLTFISVCET